MLSILLFDSLVKKLRKAFIQILDRDYTLHQVLFKFDFFLSLPCTHAEYITARFGEKDLESFAVFSLDDDPNDTVTISMFIRTRQSSGLLLILANSTSQYLCLWLEEGGVKVQVNNFETLAGQGAVSDGHFHLVTLKLEGMVAMLFQSAHKRGSMPIRPIQTHPGDLVFVGGLPDSRDTASFGGYFKGCVQDLRITSKRLQFYPITTPVGSYSLEQLVNVSQGCSSDDACAVSPFTVFNKLVTHFHHD